MTRWVYNEDDIPPTLDGWKQLVHPDDLPEAQAMLKEYFAGESPHYRATLRMKHKQGDWRKILSRGKIFETDAAGKAVRMVGTHFDITEREALIDQLSHSNEELERFAYICSHDLQEPMRMISSFTQKLQQRLEPYLHDDQKCRDYMRFVEEGALRAQALISDVLTYSSIDRDTKHFDIVDLNSLVDDVRQTLALTLQEQKATITNDTLPVIMGNKVQLYQLLLNLISNGLKYHADDIRPKVHVGLTNADHHWKFAIIDNGIGIAEKDLSHIFDVFKRLHRREKYPGTGIGLSICRKVVERHGGTIWVESQIGDGSTFYFTLLKPDNLLAETPEPLEEETTDHD